MIRARVNHPAHTVNRILRSHWFGLACQHIDRVAEAVEVNRMIEADFEYVEPPELPRG